MMQRGRCKVAIVAAIGCVLSVGGSLAVQVDSPLDVDDAKVYWRWIGKDCTINPPSAEWTKRPLAPSCMTTAFCIYEKAAGAVEQWEIEELSTFAEPEIMAVTVSPGARIAETGTAVLSSSEIGMLNNRFYNQVGRLVPLPDHRGNSDSGCPRLPEIRLTIVDTSPDTVNNSGPPESSPHGEALTLLAKELLCNSPNDCKVDVRTRLALPYKAIDPYDQAGSQRDDNHGGYLGLIGELAEVLMAEYQNWNPEPGCNDRLVLNLSLAWDRLYGGSEANLNDMPLPVQAVYHALECLACQGVITVGAAGNFSDAHPNNSIHEPLFPAAWTTRLTETCSDKRPLIYAAGGAVVIRQPLAASLAMPEFAAYSDHVTTAYGQHILTGTSVAAVGLSAMVAATSYYAPEMLSDNIFDTIYMSGELTDIPAYFCRGSPGGCPDSSYISLCESVRAACSTSYGRCSPVPSDCAIRPETLLNFAAAGLTPSHSTSSWIDVNSSTYCPANPVYAPHFPPNLCPPQQYHALTRKPGVHPQPQSNKCPTCRYEKGSTAAISGMPFSTFTSSFYIEITGLDNEKIDSLTLNLTRCALGANPQNSYQMLLPLPFNNGDTIHLTDLPECDGATLSYTLHDLTGALKGSMTVPILITE